MAQQVEVTEEEISKFPPKCHITGLTIVVVVVDMSVVAEGELDRKDSVVEDEVKRGAFSGSSDS